MIAVELVKFVPKKARTRLPLQQRLMFHAWTMLGQQRLMLQHSKLCAEMRIECVDVVGFLMEHHGAEISIQLKSLQIVASLTSERDGEIRKAALNTLATGYKILGEDIWRCVGKLTDAQKSMLDDRFKWKVREMEKRREGRPGEARAALRRSVRENESVSGFNA